ncbi:MAG: BatD family protein [Tannerellaceae bacterium]|nr:BatD family protein [Tannerellaceae bacterium]
MRRIAFLFFLLITVTSTFYGQNNVTVRISAPQAVVVGEQFKLAYVVNADAKEIRIPEIPGFDILMGPNPSVAYASRNINGQRSSETHVTYTYILMAKEEGTFTLPAGTVKVNNSNYTSNTASIKVLPPDQRTQAQSEAGTTNNAAPGLGKEDVLLRMHVSKTNVYEQEAFLVTFKLYVIGDYAGHQNLKFPEFEGFIVQDIELPNDRQFVREHYNGRNYSTAVLRQVVLIPQRSGTLSIGSAEMEIGIRVRNNVNIRSIFEEFFDTHRVVSVKLVSNKANIEVKSLPSGRPSNFSGGVGDLQMQTSINSNHVKANEAVTVKVTISGTGNIRLIKNPEVIFPNDFEIYDPKVETNIRTTTAGVSGSKTIEYLAIPRFGGDFEIPPIQLSYFDLKSNSYKTLTSEPYKLHVEKGEGGDTSSPVVSNYTNRENVQVLAEDIRYLKVKGFHFHSKEEMFFGSFLYIMCYLIPALLFIIFFVLYRKQIKENSDLALVRTKKANKMAVKRLKVAGKLLKENQEEAFYEEVLRALWGYLSDKLNIAQSNLTKDNVETELCRYGVDESLVNEFMEILNTCEFARYAPSRASDAMDTLYQQTIDAIGKMENTIKK